MLIGINQIDLVIIRVFNGQATCKLQKLYLLDF